MLYRRKVLLNILHEFNSKLPRLSLLKLALLVTRTTGATQCYDFVPYKYGAFSYSLYSDINALTREGTVSESGKAIVLNSFNCEDYKIKSTDMQAIRFVHSQFPTASTTDLITYTYNKYPFFASKSTLTQYITPEIKQKIQECISNDKSTELFTIGYEGISCEEYLDRLLINNVALLIDVRKNPISMKYGFTKNLLAKHVQDLGIKYLHLPELGIESEERQNLETYQDYKGLFEKYAKTTLLKNQQALEYIMTLLRKNKKVALTCFEKDYHYCHRGVIAQKLQTLPSWKYKLTHI